MTDSAPRSIPARQAISEAFQAALRELAYPVEVLGDGSELRSQITTPDRSSYRAQLLIDEQCQVVQSYCHLDLEYPRAKRAWILELLTRLNTEVVIGGFEFNWDDGSVALRIGVDLRHSPHTREVAESILGLSVLPLALFTKAFASHGNRKVSPKGAVEAALAREAVAENPELTSQGRRAMLVLV